MINRRHLLGIVPLAATLLLAGCAADSQTEQGQTADGLRAIRLTATVGDGARADTRAATGIQSAQFDEGEEFYAYFPSGVSVGNVSTQSGTKFTTTNTSGATHPETQPYFNAGTDNVRVHAYYGKSGGSSGTQVTNSTSSFSVALDQTEPSGYKASDLMYATTTVSVDKSIATSATANLTFSHKMSKIIVNASCGQGVSKIKKVRIVSGFKTIGIANPTTTNESTDPFFGETPSRTNAITSADNGCVKLYEDATGAESVNCAGLIPPQTITGSFLQVVTSEGTATYSLASKAFVSGESYTYTITVNLASIGITTDITNWGTTDGITGLLDKGTETLYYCGIALDDAALAVGMLICEYGRAHAYTTSELSCGGAKRARIVAVGPVANYFDHCLAIALEDVGSETYYWDDGLIAVNNWATAHPISVGYTTYGAVDESIRSTWYDQIALDASAFSNTRTSGVVKGWRMPSVTDWKYVLAGCGGKPYENNGLTNGLLYSDGVDSGDTEGSHRGLLNVFCGQEWNATTAPTAIQFSPPYWTSSLLSGEGNENRRWCYYFNSSKWFYTLKSGSLERQRYVRAVFAF